MVERLNIQWLLWVFELCLSWWLLFNYCEQPIKDNLQSTAFNITLSHIFQIPHFRPPTNILSWHRCILKLTIHLVVLSKVTPRHQTRVTQYKLTSTVQHEVRSHVCWHHFCRLLSLLWPLFFKQFHLCFFSCLNVSYLGRYTEVNLWDPWQHLVGQHLLWFHQSWTNINVLWYSIQQILLGFYSGKIYDVILNVA